MSSLRQQALAILIALSLGSVARAQQNGTVPVPDDTADDGAAQNGTVSNGTVSNGTVSAPASAPPRPTFLDTTDTRIVDTRPPPSPEQVQALREMESEVDRFTASANTYSQTVRSLVRREYLRQRRGRQQWFTRQIRAEEELLQQRRLDAIREFERFLERYPDDPSYTPDAMFRLGELYFERSAIEFQDNYDPDSDDELGTPDFMPTIQLYRDLATRFPNYRRIDGVYYLIGYCLNEMGEPEEARDAWLALVCANRFTYDPEVRNVIVPPTPEPEEDPALAAHPALGLDIGEEMMAENVRPLIDPYEGCQPLREDAQFISETWFRIGEFHFDDYGADHAVDLAISAYGRILEDPEDRNYNLALYKLAWAYYRASRYPEALDHFAQLVQWSDDQEAATGSAGSELRPEAVQYMAIALAYDDWNENGLPDTVDGMPDGMTRLQDPELIPQDRGWTPEVYIGLGQVYFDEAKYDLAIAVWNLYRQRFPNHHMVPEVLGRIADAHSERNEFEDAMRARLDCSAYGEGSDWENANLDRPAELRAARECAEQAVIASALREHQLAQRKRGEAIEYAQAGDTTEALRLGQEATQHYQAAATAYRTYLERYPNNPQAYELQYNLADALYWSENYEEAAQVYASVRDSNLDDIYLSESARRVVESLRAIMDAQGVVVRDEPPPVEGDPAHVTPVEMPQLLQDLAQARELYLARVSEAQDRAGEGVRASYEYNNALLLYWYGFWTEAKERFERIFEERCNGPNANETGRVSWETMLNMAIALDDVEEQRRLANVFSERACTFAPDGGACPPPSDEAAVQAFCADPDNEMEPCCRVRSIGTALAYRDAVQIYEQAQSASGDQQRLLYDRAAIMLVQAVNRTPENPQAPLALEYAALALEQTQRFDSARNIYQRIIDDVGPRQADDADEQARLDRIVANAYYSVGRTAASGFDFEEAVSNYRTLVDSPRFERSSDSRIQSFRRDALINIGDLFKRLQRYDDAIRYYRQLYEAPLSGGSAEERAESEAIKRAALYEIAEISFRRSNWNRTIRDMRAFIQRYSNDSAAGELVVQAYWRIAQSRQNLRQTRDYNRALGDVVTAYGRSGQSAGSLAAEYAANAAFLLADQGMSEYETLRLSLGRPRTIPELGSNLTRELVRARDSGADLVEAYEGVLGYGRPTWQVAALVREGRIFEVAVNAVLNLTIPLPTDIQRQIRGMPSYEREEIELQVQDQVRAEALDPQVRPLECEAVLKYALAARAGRAASLDNEYTQLAIDRLRAYGGERIAECITNHRENDPSFGEYQAGEFTRAPRGQLVEFPAGIAPPSLASE